ncbi:MAG TPA: hypothetical protein VLA72_02865 [Anaerolineales bacterium]|nr:hypothetical protein [Anaerolineales bacterium]
MKSDYLRQVVLNRLNRHFDDMVLAIVVLMCALPLLVCSFFVLGMEIGLLIVIGLLIALLIVCWGICDWKIFKS